MRLTKFLFSLVLALFIGAAAQTALGLNAFAVAGGVLGAGAIMPYIASESASRAGVLRIDIQIWQSHIEEEIFKDNSFLRKSHNADQYVIGGKIVHIPQSGGSGNVVRNRDKSSAAAIRTRTDGTVLYALDDYTTDPVKIDNLENYQLSYDKRNSVLGEDRDKLIQETAEWGLYNWVQSPLLAGVAATALPAGNKFLTTGATVAATSPMTGSRKAASRNDLQVLQNYFRTINKWHEGKMHIMVPPQFLMEMYPADSIITATVMQSVTEAERRMGLMFRDQGFNIYSRSSVLTTTAAGVLRAPGEAGAVTDGLAAIAWYQEAVEVAMGSIDAFEDLKNPVHYGSIFSFQVIMGGRARRSDYKGVAILRQATP